MPFASNDIWYDHNYFFQGIPSLGSWSCGGSFSLSGWLRDRDRGRRRCPRHCPTAKIIRGNDPHSNFRRGLGSLRTDRGHFPFHQERLNWTRVILSIAAAVVVTEKINKCSNLQSVEQWRPNPKESGILDYIRFHVSRFYFDIIQNVFCINSVFHAKYQTKLILYRNLTWNIFTGFSTHTTRETIISISAFTFNNPTTCYLFLWSVNCNQWHILSKNEFWRNIQCLVSNYSVWALYPLHETLKSIRIFITSIL